jgi:hypothetical protein
MRYVDPDGRAVVNIGYYNDMINSWNQSVGSFVDNKLGFLPDWGQTFAKNMLQTSPGEFMTMSVTAVAATGILKVPSPKPIGAMGVVGEKATAKGGKVVLGRYPAYTDKANKIGAKTFNVPKKIWKPMSPAKKWAANRKFLDRAIARGDEIILASPASEAKAGTFFRKELDYLIKQGYKLSGDGLRMIKP